MLPHGSVHGRAEEERPTSIPGSDNTGLPRSEHSQLTHGLIMKKTTTCLGNLVLIPQSHQQIVTNAIGNFSKSVGIQRGDDKQVCPAPQIDMKHRVRPLSPQLLQRNSSSDRYIKHTAGNYNTLHMYCFHEKCATCLQTSFGKVFQFVQFMGGSK